MWWHCVHWCSADTLEAPFLFEADSCGCRVQSPLLQSLPDELQLHATRLSGETAVMSLKEVRQFLTLPVEQRTELFSAAADLSETGLVSPPHMVREHCWRARFQEREPACELRVLSQHMWDDWRMPPCAASMFVHVHEGEAIVVGVFSRVESGQGPRTNELIEVFPHAARVMVAGDAFSANMFSKSAPEHRKWVICKGRTLFLPAGFALGVYAVRDTVLVTGDFLSDSHAVAHCLVA